MIKCGIVGFGKMGKIHANAIRLNGQAKILSVYDYVAKQLSKDSLRVYSQC